MVWILQKMYCIPKPWAMILRLASKMFDLWLANWIMTFMWLDKIVFRDWSLE